MDWQQTTSLAIVVLTAFLMVRGSLRKRDRPHGDICDACVRRSMAGKH
jgi:hypothetical protein